jgi:hypothetical protein
MRLIRASILAFIALSAASCSTSPTPVPIVATAPAAAKLAGTWEGEFSSTETRHHGSIRFELTAGTDSAFGDVTMVDDGARRTVGPRETSAPPNETTVQSLKIGFVVAQGDSVFGAMAPYPDHDGSTLRTRFEGRLRGDAIEGRYFTDNTVTSTHMSGEWSVKRRK